MNHAEYQNRSTVGETRNFQLGMVEEFCLNGRRIRTPWIFGAIFSAVSERRQDNVESFYAGHFLRQAAGVVPHVDTTL